MTVTCPACGLAFEPKRSTQRYCDRACQRNATRGPRTTATSPSQRDDKRRKRSLLIWLNTTYYATPPAQRLGLLKEWLDEAREASGLLRDVLTTPAYVRPTRDDRHSVSFRGSWAYPPVPYLADRFCRKFRACPSWDWLSGRAEEPDTGEMIDVAEAA